MSCYWPPLYAVLDLITTVDIWPGTFIVLCMYFCLIGCFTEFHQKQIFSRLHCSTKIRSDIRNAFPCISKFCWNHISKFPAMWHLCTNHAVEQFRSLWFMQIQPRDEHKNLVSEQVSCNHFTYCWPIQHFIHQHLLTIYRICCNKRPCPNKCPSPYFSAYRVDFPEHASF